MQTMPISKFKARCLAVIEEVHQTGQPLRITRFGKPLADLHPPRIANESSAWLGKLRETGAIVGDITEPSSALAAWDALR